MRCSEKCKTLHLYKGPAGRLLHAEGENYYFMSMKIDLSTIEEHLHINGVGDCLTLLLLPFSLYCKYGLL